MRIQSVTVATVIGEKYTVGHTVNDVMIDDIIQNQDTQEIHCYDSDNGLLVKIAANIPVVIEYAKEEDDV
ncbi:hypothetical protein [Pelosinus fermentans]|nr:hypothetical protein [Pelosinus fermentans]